MMTARKQVEDDLDPWTTLLAASRRLGEHRLTTMTRILKGELVGMHAANQTFVRRDTLDALLAKRNRTSDAA